MDLVRLLEQEPRPLGDGILSVVPEAEERVQPLGRQLHCLLVPELRRIGVVILLVVRTEEAVGPRVVRTPVGGELDYLDDGTLSAALKARRIL